LQFNVPVAQPDRASDFGSEGWGFESLQARILIGLIAAGVLIAFGWIAWKCVRDPKINFLSGDSRAEWILFPSAVDARTHPVALIDATFRRTFSLYSASNSARMEIRAAKRFELKINGETVPPVSVPNWKRPSIVEVARFLRVGENEIEVRVFNDDAPPALWMFLTASSSTLRSDDKWEVSIAGSSWRNCTLAAVPRKPGAGNLLTGGERVSETPPKVWRAWIFFGILAAGIAFAVNRWINDDVDLSRGKLFALVGICVFAWVALYWNNAKMLPFHAGYDEKDHIAYIKYIQDRGTLPLPNEGYEMFQPPLFYAIAAGALSIFRLTTSDAGSVAVLRGLTMLFGTANFVFVFLSMRLLFPRRALAQCIGLIMAAFLPMQLYLSHYVTNEVFAATLATLSIYLALRALIVEHSSVWQLLAIGVCVGAAMLAKATTLLLIPPLLGALTIRLWQQRAPIFDWLRTFGITIAAILITCGWYYIRIWRHFETPIVGNWDPILGFPWWQDPGVHTAADYFRFGRALIAPMFSGFDGFADGIFSTLWGDSLGGGLSGVLSRTPWNYRLMISGYWLAIVPTLLVILGVVIAVIRFARRISAKWFLLLGVSGAVALAVIFMTLKVVSYAQVKAFYGLSALVPFCAFAVVGWLTLTARARTSRFIITALLIFLAINSLASLWIRRSTEQNIYLAIRSTSGSQSQVAISEAREAVKRDPSNVSASFILAAVLDEAGDSNNSVAECERCLQLDPANSDCHFQLGISAEKQGDLTRAMSEARRALELKPEDARAYDLVFTIARELHRADEALNVGRDALTVSPFDSDLHYRIGLAAGELGDFKTATQQFAYALLLDPKKPEHEQRLGVALSFLVQTADADDVIHGLQSLGAGSPKLLEILAAYRQDRNSSP
jgi:Flp pilus assembly protein TadD